MIKVRLQLANNATPGAVRPSALSVARSMTLSEMYTGLSAGLLRQAVYTTARIGLFDTFMGTLTKRAKDAGRPVGFADRAVAGLGAGGLGESARSYTTHVKLIVFFVKLLCLVIRATWP
jgi:solute carrier family 25 oxoglutarate transporter 11